MLTQVLEKKNTGVNIYTTKSYHSNILFCKKTITQRSVLHTFGYQWKIIVLCLKNLCTLASFRSEPWDYISWGEQGKQHAWEPVGHSTLTDWNKYCGIV